MKRCSACGQHKVVDEFYPSKRHRDGKKPDCISCRKESVRAYREANLEQVRTRARRRSRSERNRERENEQQRKRASTPEGRAKARQARLKSAYGLTSDDYDRLLVNQGGCCAICKLPPRGVSDNSARLHVDHDHETGAVRALLCAACNKAIGLFREDRGRILVAMEYLRQRP